MFEKVSRSLEYDSIFLVHKYAYIYIHILYIYSILHTLKIAYSTVVIQQSNCFFSSRHAHRFIQNTDFLTQISKMSIVSISCIE